MQICLFVGWSVGLVWFLFGLVGFVGWLVGWVWFGLVMFGLGCLFVGLFVLRYHSTAHSKTANLTPGSVAESTVCRTDLAQVIDP